MAVDPNELYDQLMRQNAAEQDIQAIAKQISDHAEAIYQTWKSKGLTPNELLHLHGEVPAPDQPSSPQSASLHQQPMSSRGSSGIGRSTRSSSTPERQKSVTPLSPVELLASPQLEATLEELVNSFVQEDKARLAARARTGSPAPISAGTSLSVNQLPIQTALRRFEKKGVSYELTRRQQSPVPEQKDMTVTVKNNPPSTFQEAVQSASRASPVAESIDTVKSRAQRFASRIELANSGSSSPWSTNKRSSCTTTSVTTTSIVTTEVTHQVAAVPAIVVPSSMEVDKEEERLINALKTGQVINQVPTSPTSTTEHFLMVKKARERQQQQQHQQRVSGTEEELNSLVDRLRESQSSTPTNNRSIITISATSRESSPALLGIRESSPSRCSSPRSVKLSETVPIAGVSTVDYAKVRYQAAQANPLTQQRLEDSRTIGKAPNTPQPNVVSETRSRFEGGRSSTVSTTLNTSTVPWRTPGGTLPEWSPIRPQTDHSSPGGLNLEALRRIKTRKMRKSPEPQNQSPGSTSPTTSPLPHPELTVQQRQHLRERINLHGAGTSSGMGGNGAVQLYTSTGIPIRPFLTRGSVAERVLIFEKCPTAIIASSSATATATAATAISVESGKNPATLGSGLTSPVLGSASSSSSSTSVSAESGNKTKRAGSPAPQGWRHTNDVLIHPNRSQGYVKDSNKENRSTSPSSSSSSRSTLRRQAKANNNLLLPRFYYPTGRPISKKQLESSLQRLVTSFQQLPNCQASREHFGSIAKACGCPFYWKSILFIASGGDKLGHVSLETFSAFWEKIISNYHDEASRFVQLLTMINPMGRTTMDSNFNGPTVNGPIMSSGRNHLVPEDFVPLVQDVVDTHPGLTFLKEAAEFHSRYVHTVIARIFYNVNRSWSGQITLAELRHSNLLATIQLLEEEDDINQITDYFSYEHFYVIYCKFWELDKDHDLFIDKKDLARHNDHALSSKMIDRIFSGAVTRGASQNNKLAAKFGTANHNSNNINHQPRMSYTEFVWFLISEEDKRHPTAIEYWFRCMDLDGDGYLSMYELEYFYEEQLQRMESLGIETLPFEDCLCQMLDMIHPSIPGKVSLNDLKRCQMTPIFFDTFFNLEKYLDHEQRDPFASQRDPDSENGDEILKISDWDRYAAEEYELLVAEEGGPDHNEDMFMREEMAAATDEMANGDQHHSSMPMSLERDVIMSEPNELTGQESSQHNEDDYVPMVGHSLGGHRSLFSVTPVSIEYQY